MISKSTIKFYLIPGIIALVIIGVILLIPFRNRFTTSPIAPTIVLPTRFPFPTNSISPSLIPVHNFTGADINQELPPNIKSLGEQKTTLRKLTPFTLPFGKIEFDYVNDKFTLTLIEPKDQSQTTFNAWLKQTYPAIPREQFAIR